MVKSLKSDSFKEGPQYLQLAYYQMLLGQFDDAFSSLEEGIECRNRLAIRPPSKACKPYSYPNLLFQGKLDEAKKIYQELLALPEDPVREQLNYTLEVEIFRLPGFV